MSNELRENTTPAVHLRRASYFFLFASCILLALYFANVLSGKLAIIYGIEKLVNFNDVTEFILLFLAAITFVVATLLRESSDDVNGI